MYYHYLYKGKLLILKILSILELMVDCKFVMGDRFMLGNGLTFGPSFRGSLFLTGLCMFSSSNLDQKQHL